MTESEGFPHADQMAAFKWVGADEEKILANSGDIHDDYVKGVYMLTDTFRRLCRRAEVPHSLQDHMAQNGHVDATLFEMRWDTEQAIRTHAATWLGITDWPAKYKMRYSLVMMQLLRMAKALQKGQLETPPKTRPSSQTAYQVDTLQDADRRKRVEVAWARHTPNAPFPRMSRQPSDQLLKLVFPIFEAGRIPTLEWKDLTALLSDLAMKETDWTEKEYVDGEYVKTDKKKAKILQTTREWERAMEIHDNTMLMVANCHKTNSKMDLDYEKIMEWANHFRGPVILQRNPEPPMWLLRDIFTTSWGHVAHRMQEHSEKISESMDAIKQDNMFWSMHFTERYQKWEQSGGKSTGKGRRTGAFARRNAARANDREYDRGRDSNKGTGKRRGKGEDTYIQPKGRGKYDKGNGKHKGKGKGKGAKGKDKTKSKQGQGTKRKNDMMPDNYCREDKGGRRYCMNFHIRNNCKDGYNCWNSHNCPVWVPSKNGPCNVPQKVHRPWACPHNQKKRSW